MTNIYFSFFGNRNPFEVDLPHNKHGDWFSLWRIHTQTGVFPSLVLHPRKGSMPSQLYKSEWLHIMVPKTASLEGWIWRKSEDLL